MKRVLPLFPLLVCLLALAGCGHAVPEKPERGTPAPESTMSVRESICPDVEAFSYREVLSAYASGEPGVWHTGFANTSEAPTDTAEDAIERAKQECTVPYDTVRIGYDENAAMWKVAFYLDGTLGGDQCVYMDSSGITHLIVFGE